MQKQPVKTATRNIGVKQTPAIQISNPRNKKEHLRTETKRKLLNQATIIVSDTQKRDDGTRDEQLFFIPRPPIKPTEESKRYPQNLILSPKPLTARQINLFRRGLKFSTTPKPNTIELKSDAQEFTRKLRLTLKSLIAQ